MTAYQTVDAMVRQCWRRGQSLGAARVSLCRQGVNLTTDEIRQQYVRYANA